MALKVDIVTAERLVYSEEGVERLIVPGVEGELGVLTLHAPLLTMIQPGVLRIVKGGAEVERASTGGFPGRGAGPPEGRRAPPPSPGRRTTGSARTLTGFALREQTAPLIFTSSRDDTKLVIEGGRPLEGVVDVSGSKNATMGAMAAALLVKEDCYLENAPAIGDVGHMAEVLRSLGAVVESTSEHGLRINTASLTQSSPPRGR